MVRIDRLRWAGALAGVGACALLAGCNNTAREVGVFTPADVPPPPSERRADGARSDPQPRPASSAGRARLQAPPTLR